MVARTGGRRGWRTGPRQMPDPLQYRLDLGRWRRHPDVAGDGLDRPRAALDHELRKVRGTKSIYHNNSIQSWLVSANGEVSNVQVG